MTLWWGIWFLCVAKLHDGYWVSIVSPLFVMLLLFKGSGIPMQEKQVLMALHPSCTALPATFY
jgi:steroid 5-alpha reductase family enzyme